MSEEPKRTETKQVSVLESTKKIEEAAKKKQLNDVYKALELKGYEPIRQLVGYILTGDPTYITTTNNARDIMRSFDRFELIEIILNDFYRDQKKKEQ